MGLDGGHDDPLHNPRLDDQVGDLAVRDAVLGQPDLHFVTSGTHWTV
jgi:hypothetical protein